MYFDPQGLRASGPQGEGSGVIPGRTIKFIASYTTPPKDPQKIGGRLGRCLSEFPSHSPPECPGGVGGEAGGKLGAPKPWTLNP